MGVDEPRRDKTPCRVNDIRRAVGRNALRAAAGRPAPYDIDDAVAFDNHVARKLGAAAPVNYRASLYDSHCWSLRSMYILSSGWNVMSDCGTILSSSERNDNVTPSRHPSPRSTSSIFPDG